MFKMISEMLDINHSVLSGSMDIIVVKHSDSKYISSPFNIRFGGLKILKTKEKIVDIFVNGIKSDLTMRLNANGDGFFVIDKEQLEENNNRKKRLSEIIINQNVIAKNVENEIERSNDIDRERSNYIENSISNVLSIEPLNLPGTSNKDTDLKKSLTKVEDKNDIQKINNLEEGIMLQETEEYVFAESDIEDLDEDIKIESIKTNNRAILLENKKIDINVNFDQNKENDHINSLNANSNDNNKNNSLFDESSDIIISDCLSSLLKNPNKANEIFNNNIISSKLFLSDPWSIINNQNIVFKLRDEIFPIKVGLPLILSKLFFKTELPEETIKKLYHNKTYFGIKSCNLEPELKKIKLEEEIKPNDLDRKSNSFPDDLGFDIVNDINYDINKKQSLVRRETLSNKVKSTSPTTEQIKMLNLKKGKNDIKFVCRSRLSGEHILESEIYLWDKDDKIIISDVDGTITKSDVLGQLMPIFGNDWAQPGVTELFNSIEKNGYKIIYLTARAICQSSITKTYLNNLNQNNFKLPKGPLVMSPDGLFTSFKREVIDKTPQILKIAILTGIKSIFPNNYEPFHAGFGNRNTDAVSYRAIGIKMSNIFIIDEKGEIKQLNNSYKKSYSLLNEIVDQLFPNLNNILG